MPTSTVPTIGLLYLLLDIVLAFVIVGVVIGFLFWLIDNVDFPFAPAANPNFKKTAKGLIALVVLIVAIIIFLQFGNGFLPR